MLAVLHEVLQSYWHSLKNSVGTLLVVALWIIMFRCALACAVRAAVSAGVRLRVSRPADAPRAGGAGGDSIIGLDFFCGCKFDRHNITGQTNFDTIQASLELMFRIAVGGDYIGVMDAISIQPPFCTPDPFEQGNVQVAGMFDTKIVVPAIGGCRNAA